MENIKVSVVLPVYNVEKYLRECLDSLINQTLKDIEIICVDDGSTDSSLEILNEYKNLDERVIVLTQQNMYAGVARNKGMSIARGEYLLFLDSDDFFDLKMLEKVYIQAIKTDADVVLFGAKTYNTIYGSEQEAPWILKRSLLPDKEVFSREDIPDDIFSLTTSAPWSKLFKRDFVIKKGLEFQPLHNSNDLFFVYLGIIVAERITCVCENLVYYRTGLTKNLQTVKKRHPLCFFEAYEALYRAVEKRDVFETVRKSLVNMIVAGCAFNLDTTQGYEARIKIIEKLGTSEFVRDCLTCDPVEFYDNLSPFYKVLGCRYAYAQLLEFKKLQGDNETVCIKEATLKEEPFVSVIIPVYNVEKYIGECLDSIISQTLENIEIICVNDGSPDNSFDVVKAYAEKDGRISLYEQPNMGPAETRNRAMLHARGKYLYFMDSDDILEADALRKLFERAEKDKLDILFFDATSFSDGTADQKHTDAYKDYYHRQASYDKSVYSGVELMSEFEKNGEYRVAVWQHFMRREFQVENSIYYIKGILHEDNPFTFESLLLAERAGHLNETLYKRRVREGSIMTSNVTFANVYGYFRSYLKMNSVLGKNPQFSQNKEVLNISLKIIKSLRNMYSKLDEGEKYAYYAFDNYMKNLFDVYVLSSVVVDSDFSERFKKVQEEMNFYRERLFSADADKREIRAKLRNTYKVNDDLKVRVSLTKKEVKALKKESEQIEKRLSQVRYEIKHPFRYFMKKLLRFLHLKK